MRSSAPDNELAKRLAKKAGLDEKQTSAFIQALRSLIAEEQTPNSTLGLLLSAVAQDSAFAHTFLIPMDKDAHGKVTIPDDAIPIVFPRTPLKKGVQPPLFAGPISGGYPGPLFTGPFAKIVIDSGEDPFDLGKIDFGGLTNALSKAMSAPKINVASTLNATKPGKKWPEKK